MRWKTLEHNGITFPEQYQTKKGVNIKIKGKSIPLGILSEEMVYQWAKKKDTHYVQDEVFQDNFTDDLVKELRSDPKTANNDIVKQGIAYQDIDFTDAYNLVQSEKDKKKPKRTKRERETSKREKG